MASPIAHSLLGVAVAHAMPWNQQREDWRWYAFLIVAAVAPDFDFLPGLIAGNVNRFHQGPSHSLLAALVFGLLTWAVLRAAGRRAVLAGVAGGLSYTSHLLLDVFTEDSRAPFGIPVFWPLQSDHFIAPWQIFSGVRHARPGDDLATFLDELLSLANAKTAVIDLCVLAPVVIAVFWLRGRYPGLVLRPTGAVIARQPNSSQAIRRLGDPARPVDGTNLGRDPEE